MRGHRLQEPPGGPAPCTHLSGPAGGLGAALTSIVEARRSPGFLRSRLWPSFINPAERLLNSRTFPASATFGDCRVPCVDNLLCEADFLSFALN